MFGDSQHPWMRKGHLFTKGPGTYKIHILSCVTVSSSSSEHPSHRVVLLDPHFLFFIHFLCGVHVRACAVCDGHADVTLFALPFLGGEEHLLSLTSLSTCE